MIKVSEVFQNIHPEFFVYFNTYLFLMEFFDNFLKVVPDFSFHIGVNE